MFRLLFTLSILNIASSFLTIQFLNAYQRAVFLKQSLNTLHAKQDTNTNTNYINPLTELVSKLLPSKKDHSDSKISSINWSERKQKRMSLSFLAKKLEKDLIKKEWFVTGDVEPSYFSDEFVFQDPDVTIKGIKSYAVGVNKLFDQRDARAEIVKVNINPDKSNTITVVWRLSGSVKVGFGLLLKPFVVITDFTITPKDGLISFQEDKFSLPGYDIVLSALFPGLVKIGLLSQPSPDVNILKQQYK